jgi:hypothetical protein
MPGGTLESRVPSLQAMSSHDRASGFAESAYFTTSARSALIASFTPLLNPYRSW